MTRLLLILALAALAFWVYSVVDCAVQSPTRHRGVSKPTWIVIVLIFPVLGGVLWFVVGRDRRRGAREARVDPAPDDDPRFLQTLSGVTDTDERIRRLEEELAHLDDEDDSARGGDSGVPRRDDDDPSGAHGTRGGR